MQNRSLALEAWQKLNSFQQHIIYDINPFRKGTTLSVPMGAGKTLMSLFYGIDCYERYQVPFIVICSKTLLVNWQNEIYKFFGSSLPFQVLHSSVVKNLQDWKLQSDTIALITTPEFLRKVYNEQDVERYATDWVPTNPNHPNFGLRKEYRIPLAPFLHWSSIPGTALLYQREWSAVIIDEAQNYTNIETNACKAIVALASFKRLLLSGTIFMEPVINRVMGYLYLLHEPNVPAFLEDFERYVYGARFSGLAHTQVIRETNPEFIAPKDVQDIIVQHQMSDQEKRVYRLFKLALLETAQRLKTLHSNLNSDERRSLSCSLAVIMNYCRQSLVCSIMPIAQLAVQLINVKKKSELTLILNEKLDEQNLSEWLQTDDPVYSSRIQKLCEILQEHNNDRCVMFSCFKCNMQVIQHFVKQNRTVFQLESKMSIKQRAAVLEAFAQTPASVLLLTYKLGSEGLNLQCANVVILVDFWWNAGVTKQAVARVLRMGQRHDSIRIYFLTSNTGVEKFLFMRQIQKLEMIKELQTGPLVTTKSNMSVDDICDMCNMDDTVERVQQIKCNYQK